MKSSVVGWLSKGSLGRLATVGLAWIGLAVAAPAQAEVTVVTSIKPLAMIVRPVVGDDGDVDYLLPPSASPHDYPLKVSDMQRLANADLVVWVGPSLETFLQRALRPVPDGALLTVSELDGLHWPAAHQQDHDHGHDHGERDPHLWLNPENVGRLALALGERLATLDPPAAARYRARARDFAQSVEALDTELGRSLAPVEGVPFAVYHDGYSHFVGRYGLTQRAAVTVSPERRPGARHLYELRQTLAGAACLFTEPYYDMSAARRLAGELSLRVGEVDILGARSEVNTYTQLMRRLAEDMVACLRPPA